MRKNAKEMTEFNTNLKLFYKAGECTFLTKNKIAVGDDETFYLHRLPFYLPKFVEKPFTEHNLEIRIFQGRDLKGLIKNPRMQYTGLVIV